MGGYISDWYKNQKLDRLKLYKFQGHVIREPLGLLTLRKSDGAELGQNTISLS